jgi:hypothetical protein
MKVRCITLTQPFATLLVTGLKKNETRPFHIANPKILQQIKEHGLYIHAGVSKNVKIDGKKVNCRELCNTKYFKEAIGGGNGYDKLPFGAIIGKVDYNSEWAPTEDINLLSNTARRFQHDWKTITDKEFAFGDYGPERYAWKLENPVQFGAIIPCAGQLGVWEYDMPEHFHIPNQYGSHATVSGPVDNKTMAAINTLADVAYNTLKKLPAKKDKYD